MMDEKEVKTRIDELESRKSGLIEKIKEVNRRLRYKKYEQKALAPFVEQTKDIRIGPIRKKKNAIEFKISTQAYTPRLEREWLKEVRKLDEKLKEVREIEWARKKKKLVDRDIEIAEADVIKIETELKKIREELKGLYGDARVIKAAGKRGVKIGKFEDDMVTLEDLMVVEKKGE